VARPPDKSSASQFRTQSYIESWAANNPFYAPHVNWAFDTTDTTLGRSAAYSGNVQVAGYNNVTPQNKGIDENNPINWASPVRRGTAYDRFGAVNKQVGDVQLGLVLMGGYQFPGQAFSPERTKSGLWGANPLAKWMNKQGVQGYVPEGRRYRNGRRETGWSTMLSRSITSNKAVGGVGQSSEDSTQEVYSTQETRLATRAEFTNEQFNAEAGKFGRTWAGFKPLSTHSLNPHFDSKLGQMFKTENANTGFARRSTERRL
jgi:hypothetical protein